MILWNYQRILLFIYKDYHKPLNILRFCICLLSYSLSDLTSLQIDQVIKVQYNIMAYAVRFHFLNLFHFLQSRTTYRRRLFLKKYGNILKEFSTAMTHLMVLGIMFSWFMGHIFPFLTGDHTTQKRIKKNARYTSGIFYVHCLSKIK